ncbi:MAG: 3-phosphoshikimate 1-carboxyvinyltransferase [Bdellovibrionota bacterium]
MNANRNISIEIEPSKSIMNRALICKSYSPDLKIEGFSRAEDVAHLQNCLLELEEDEVFNCGEGGTTFRFFSLRASRRPGRYEITGTDRLMKRPQEEIVSISKQLGFSAQLWRNLILETDGWIKPEGPIQVSQEKSSQFLSAVLLNCWNLDFDITIESVGGKISDSYLQMTIQFLKQMGMKIEVEGSRYFVPAYQNCAVTQIKIEPDMSSAFFVAAFASPGLEVEIKKIPENSIQPDFAFVKYLKEMGFNLDFGKSLKISREGKLKAIDANLESNPDLFPVLAVLCAAAEGDSHLTGLSSLQYKESNRLMEIEVLLEDLGVSFQSEDDAITINGLGRPFENAHLDYYPNEDHRLVMAAMIAKNLGAKITVTDVKPIAKSFPQFFSPIFGFIR